MDKRNLQTQIIAISILVVAFGALFFWSKGVKETRQAEEATLKIMAENLYHNWINYEGSPVADKKYNDPELFSAEARSKFNAVLSSTSSGGYDPVLCAQDVPESVTVGEIVVNGNKATFVVVEKFPGIEKKVPVKAVKESGRWKIADISCTGNEQKQEADFVRMGNLVKDSPGLKVGVWYLNYESPGAPALVQQLTFLGNTICKINSVVQPCNRDVLTVGMRVEVKGRQEGNTVLVYELNILETPSQTQNIKLYYYNSEKDKVGDNVGCSQDAVLPVERTIPKTVTPVKDAINLLLQGQLTDSERTQGYTTEFPHDGFRLLSANLKDGTLTLHFSEVPGFTDGGSCRMGLMAASITKTAMQFSGVNKVVFTPETLFQP